MTGYVVDAGVVLKWLAVDLDHPVHDCLYLAPGMQEHYPVMTADTRFHDEVRAHPCLGDRIVHVARV